MPIDLTIPRILVMYPLQNNWYVRCGFKGYIMKKKKWTEIASSFSFDKICQFCCLPPQQITSKSCYLEVSLSILCTNQKKSTLTRMQWEWKCPIFSIFFTLRKLAPNSVANWSKSNSKYVQRHFPDFKLHTTIWPHW